VVSAYAGITNSLLENKRTGEPGVYARFAAGEHTWVDRLRDVRQAMRGLNRQFETLGLDIRLADAFVDERIEGVTSCLEDLMRVRSYGHLHPSNYLPASRELLSSIGEAHSAYNSALILKQHGVNARFVDLTCWKETDILPLDDVIRKAFREIDLDRELPIVTGYVKCDVGIMTHFDRGYSEITFSKVAVVTGAREGIIHKEYHLCTGDPELVGLKRVRVIGNTNFDIADQMSDLNMEAIHARASKEMQLRNIPIRVKNAFEPDHPGTLISKEYTSPDPKVEMISGRDDIIAVEVCDAEMVGQSGYDYRLLSAFADADISYLAKSTNANTITHFVSDRSPKLDHCLRVMAETLPEACIRTQEVAIVSVLGSNMRSPEFLSRATAALAAVGVQVLGVVQTMRLVNIQFFVERAQFDQAQLALHAELVEKQPGSL
jgi:aspartate kinase